MNSDGDSSEEESEEIGNDLLIESMVIENRKKEAEELATQSHENITYDKIMVNSLQIIPSPVVNKQYSSYLEAALGQPVVTELVCDDVSCQQNPSIYSVQSPDTSDEKVEVIPTPPVMEENQIRLSQRSAGVNLEHVIARAEKLTKKRNLQGMQKPDMEQTVKKGAELLKMNASQMMLLCGPPKPDAGDHDDT